MPRKFDDVDRRLVEELRLDGRLPNKHLAQLLGIAETTVASRLRQLREDRMMLVTLRQDLYSKGFDLQCFADIYVIGRPVDVIARELAHIEAVSSVALLMGSPQILATFNAVGRRDMLSIIDDQIARVKGVSRVEINVALDIRRYETGYANLSSLGQPEFATKESQSVTDDLDVAIIAQFQQDGRLSNREVGRRLDVSEGTVRQRLRKLEAAGAVRFDVVTDPVCDGIEYFAHLRLAVAPDRLESALEVCAALPQMWYVAATAGRYNLIAVMSTANAQQALEVLHGEIEVLAGVGEIDVRTLYGIAKHNFNEIVIRPPISNRRR